MADLWVSRVTESGLSDHQYFCRTHLGHLLSPGDTVYGFDFTNANLNNPDLEKVKAEKLPDVVVVKKAFGDKTTRNRKRRWKLKHLHDDLHMETASNDRWVSPTSKIAMDTTDTEDEDLPQIKLLEMLDDLHIADNPMEDED
ncbi:60S ribosomal export protein NMD3-like [Crassostrea virginica]